MASATAEKVDEELTLGRAMKEPLQANLERIKKRIQAKQQEIKDLEQEAKQADQAIKALG